MRLDLNKKPEGVWCSFNEHCGTGDGKNKEFKAPLKAKEAHSILVLRGFTFMTPGRRLVVKNEKTGSIEKDVPDGYRLEVRDEDDLWIVFDEAPEFDEPVSVSGLSRKVGDAFCILPWTTAIEQKIREEGPAVFRGPKKNRENISEQDAVERGKICFTKLVVDWTGIDDGDGNQLPCDTETKKVFLEKQNAAFFGFFVQHRSEALQLERMQSFQRDSTD